MRLAEAAPLRFGPRRKPSLLLASRDRGVMQPAMYWRSMQIMFSMTGLQGWQAGVLGLNLQRFYAPAVLITTSAVTAAGFASPTCRQRRIHTFPHW